MKDCNVSCWIEDTAHFRSGRLQFSKSCKAGCTNLCSLNFLWVGAVIEILSSSFQLTVFPKLLEFFHRVWWWRPTVKWNELECMSSSTQAGYTLIIRPRQKASVQKRTEGPEIVWSQPHDPHSRVVWELSIAYSSKTPIHNVDEHLLQQIGLAKCYPQRVEHWEPAK